MNIETEIALTFILRIFYALIVFAVFILVLYLRSFFHNAFLRSYLRSFAIWLFILATARGTATLFDYFFDVGVGVMPLILNNLCWIYVVYKFGMLAFLFSKSKKANNAIHITETTFEEIIRMLRENTQKTDDLKEELEKHL